MNLLLDALQAGNCSGTGTYVRELLGRLPLSPGITTSTALLRPGTVYPNWKQLTLPPRPRIASIVHRHAMFGRYIDETRPDVVHFPANFGTLLPIRANHPSTVVTTLHDLTFFRNPNWFPKNRAILYQRLARQAVRQSHLLISDSQSSAADIRHYLRVPEDRIVVIPLGCEGGGLPIGRDRLATMRARYGLPPTFFLFVGTIEPRKNLPRLIRAWSSISVNCGCDLVIAGRAGWKTREYSRAVREASQSARIHQIGFVPAEDLPALMACATAFVWPSLYEGFGLPPLDAMASGIPVLTSAVSSIPEVVGDAALLVDPEDENAIAKGLLRILRDEKLRDRLTRAGRDRARQLSWERTVTQTVHAYRQAIEISK